MTTPIYDDDGQADTRPAKHDSDGIPEPEGPQDDE